MQYVHVVVHKHWTKHSPHAVCACCCTQTLDKTLTTCSICMLLYTSTEQNTHHMQYVHVVVHEYWTSHSPHAVYQHPQPLACWLPLPSEAMPPDSAPHQPSSTPCQPRFPIHTITKSTSCQTFDLCMARMHDQRYKSNMPSITHW